MNATEFQSLLGDLGACVDAVKWAQDKDLHTVWTTCRRGDWLLWLCGRMVDKPNWPTRKQLVLAACSCAETSLKYVPSGEDRQRVAIETARKWARGTATIKEVRQAAADAYAYAYAASAAASAAAYVAYAAAADAADAASAARAKALAECAEIVRLELPEPSREGHSTCLGFLEV